MKIAYLTQSYTPMISGAALVVENLAKAMSGNGHQVLVIAASDKGQTYIVRERNLTVLRLKSLHNPTRVGQRFVLYPRRSVLDALREFKPDIIHAHEPLPMSLPGIIYASTEYIPIVLTIHQLPSVAMSYLPGFLSVATEAALCSYARWFTKKFTSIITPTETTSIEATKILGRTVNTISNGIDLQTFHPPLPHDDEVAIRQKLNLPPAVPLLLHVGRLDPDKYVDRVIHAAAQILRGNEAHLLIVGDGVRKSSLIKLCESQGIASSVHFTGFVSGKQGLPEIYRISHLFVTASEMETQGIVLLEAAASGLPIIGVRASSIPEIVHDGVNGILAEPGDSLGLSNAMAIVLKDKEKAMNMGRASQLLAQQHDIHFSIDAHEILYRQLVEHATVVYPTRKTGGKALAKHV